MGPLEGYKIVEIAGIGPGQFCGMLLADMGARLIRIDNPAGGERGVAMPAQYNLMNRSRPVIGVDLKEPEGVDLVLRLCAGADALFEGFRPGVMERLGLGPDECMARNPRLVYGRITGWGQDGPLADTAGHDTNYIALAGALGTLGEAQRPPPVPLNLIGDFGGGGLYLALGMLAALLEAQRSGQGQVVDAAMVDGTASMMTLFYGMLAGGLWQDRRGVNLFDGSAPFVRTYETRDGEYVAVCAIEGRFFAALLEALETDEIDPKDQYDRASWPEHHAVLARLFRSRTREEWTQAFDGTDACFAPVLSLMEAAAHPHSKARNSYLTVDDVLQPAPAPRFSRTPSQIQCAPSEPGGNAEDSLADWGLTDAEIERLHRQGIVNAR
ncbi:MAG: CoA transferase [Gammaproteobacteria bacterium]|nr:CoA transferase [Gammaproteobacteria bacterium]